jgi:uncharacterized membrane protein
MALASPLALGTAASLTLGNRAWAAPVLALLALAVTLALLAYRRLPPERRSRAGLALRLAGLAVLALALLEPSRTTPRARPGANLFVVLADNSRSLQLPAAGGGGASRGQRLRARLDPATPFLRALADSYQLRRYQFDARLERVPDFGALTFQGEASHLGSALRALGERYRGGPLAGVLLFTDGNATDLGDAPALAAAVAGLPPIYPVPLGRGAGADDVAVPRVSASETLFEDTPVAIDAQIEASGALADGRTLTVELRDGQDRVVDSQRLTTRRDEAAATVRFRVRPAQPGLVGYRVQVAPAPGEATAANNGRQVLVERPQGPSRLLYVGGRPNWEYKFLHRALASDARALELVALVRVAPREPKFAFLSRRGEVTNPLFRGFGHGAEEAERFDEPVLVRLGTRDAHELEAGFPATPEGLFDFQAVILDDVEAGFFTAAQQALVERFVTERGGGLLMLGGQGSFHHGGYDRTPIGDLLPVYVDRVPPAPAAAAGARLVLSREGWLEAWTRLRSNESAERARLDAMPAFKVLSRARSLKPGATVLATATVGKSSHPALVVQRAGAGRTAALTVGDLWRWGLRRSPGEAEDLSKFWRQTLRWLVSDVPRPVTVELVPRAGEPGAFTARVRARGRDFRPADAATVALEAIAPDGTRTPLVAEPAAGAGDDGAAAGSFEAAYRPRAAGLHRVHARVTAPDGRSLGDAEAGRAIDLAADEHRSVRPNLALLEGLARATGGAVVGDGAGDLDAFVRRLRDRPAPISDLETRPLWHSWMVLALALGCFAGEWALRRRRGLP